MPIDVPKSEIYHIRALDNIDNYYIGEVRINSKNYDIDFTNFQNKETICKVRKGAIDIPYSFDVKTKTNSILTILNRHQDIFACLYNHQYYRLSECKNLLSLREIISKLDVTIPEKIKGSGVIMLYRYLFDPNTAHSFEQLYNTNLYDIGNFYTGKLYLCESNSIYKNYAVNFDKQNVIQNYILNKSSAKLTGLCGFLEKIDTENIYHNYLIYNCLFYNNHNANNFYNLNDTNIYYENQQYNENRILNGENLYQIMGTFEEFLEANNYNIKKKKLSIASALKLYRMYNK